MPFDQTSIRAALSLGRILPEEMPKVAWDALEAGHDGPAIRRMAAFEKPTGFEVDEVLPAFRHEAGIPIFDKSDAALRVAYDIAREILDLRKDPTLYAETFARLWIEADYPSEIQSLGTWPDEIYLSVTYGGTNTKEVQKELSDQLILFIRDYEQNL